MVKKYNGWPKNDSYIHVWNFKNASRNFENVFWLKKNCVKSGLKIEANID